MEQIFWFGIYVLGSIIMYLLLVWSDDYHDYKKYSKYYPTSFFNTVPHMLFSVFWPAALAILILSSPFYGAFKLYGYLKTRKVNKS